MNIAVVAYEMEGSKTGVGRYLEGLLRGVSQCRTRRDSPRHQDTQWTLFFKGEPFEHPLLDEDSPFEPVFDHRPEARPILWEQLRLPRLLRQRSFDLVFSPAYSLPPGKQRSLVTMHDLSFEHLPQEFDFKERWRRRLLARRAVRQASRVLVDTRAIAADLERTYGLERERIGVVPLALDQIFSNPADPPPDPATSARQLDELGVRSPYLLFVGSILPRRRLDLVLDLTAELATQEPRLRLVLVGQNRLKRAGQLARLIESKGLGRRVLHLGYVSEALLPTLYRQAALSIYLSTYEGFGLPPLESLACGTPVIVSKGQALDDVWPAYPYRCELDSQSVRAMGLRAWREKSDRQRVIDDAGRHLETLRWEHSADRFLDEIDRALA